MRQQATRKLPEDTDNNNALDCPDDNAQDYSTVTTYPETSSSSTSYSDPEITSDLVIQDKDKEFADFIVPARETELDSAIETVSAIEAESAHDTKEDVVVANQYTYNEFADFIVPARETELDAAIEIISVIETESAHETKEDVAVANRYKDNEFADLIVPARETELDAAIETISVIETESAHETKEDVAVANRYKDNEFADFIVPARETELDSAIETVSVIEIESKHEAKEDVVVANRYKDNEFADLIVPARETELDSAIETVSVIEIESKHEAKEDVAVANRYKDHEFADFIVPARETELDSAIETVSVIEIESKHEAKEDVANRLVDAKETAKMNIDPPSLGKLLSQAREEQGISIESVANRLYLEPRIIDALEKERYDKLPPVIFVQGYLRSYARLLNLSVEEVLRIYYQSTDQTPPKLSSEATVRKHVDHVADSPHHTRRWWNGVTVLLLLVLIGLVAWRYAGNLSLPDWSNMTATSPDGEQPANVNVVDLPPQPSSLAATTHTSAPIIPPSGNGAGEYTPPTESPDENALAPNAAAGNTETLVAANTDMANATSTATATSAPANAEGDTATATAASNTATATSTSADSTATAENNSAADAQAVVLDISFKGASWVSITDSNGKRLVYGVSKAGQQHRIEQVAAPIKVSLGRPEEVERFTFRGEAVDLSTYKGVAKFNLE